MTQNVENILEEAKEAIRTGDYTNAHELLTPIVEIPELDDKTRARAWWILSHGAATTIERLEYVNNISKVYPQNDQVLKKLEQIKEDLAMEVKDVIEQGDKDKARESLKRILELNAYDLQSWLSLYDVVETDEERKACLDKIIEIDPENQDAHQKLHDIEYQKGISNLRRDIQLALEEKDKEKARDLLSQAMQLDENNESDWWTFYEIAETNDGRHQALEKITAINPENTKAASLLEDLKNQLNIAASLREDASQAIQTGDKSKAKFVLRKVLEIDEHSEHDWWTLYGIVDSNDERIECLEKIILANPEDIGAREALRIFKSQVKFIASLRDEVNDALQQGDKKKSRIALGKLLELDEHNEQDWLALYELAETNEQRINCLEKIVAIHPENKDAHAKLQKIRRQAALSHSVVQETRQALREHDKTKVRIALEKLLQLDDNYEEIYELFFEVIEVDEQGKECLTKDLSVLPLNDEVKNSFEELRNQAELYISLVTQAKLETQKKDSPENRKILAQLLQLDEHFEQVWLLLFDILQVNEEFKECFEKADTINEESNEAHSLLEELNQYLFPIRLSNETNLLESVEPAGEAKPVLEAETEEISVQLQEETNPDETLSSPDELEVVSTQSDVNAENNENDSDLDGLASLPSETAEETEQPEVESEIKLDDEIISETNNFYR